MNNFLKTPLILLLLSLQFNMCSQYREVDGLEKHGYAETTINNMLFLLAGDERMSEAVLLELDHTWEEGYIPMLLDVIYFSRGNVDYRPIVKLIEKKTGKKYGADIFKWYEWVFEILCNYHIYAII